MRLIARFPLLAAWVLTLALIAVGTLGALQGLRALQPSAPGDLYHVHGVIVATGRGEIFAAEIPGEAKPIWFRVARGAPVSFAHVLRHLQEHAPTDIYYLPAQKDGLPLAWIAD
jgi:hypothetical protein